MLRSNIIRQTVIIILISVLLGLIRNFGFSDGIDLVADPAVFRTGSSAPILPARELEPMFEDGVAVFIDARDKSEYEEAHIEGAANLDVRRFDKLYAKIRRFVDESTPLVVYAGKDEPQVAGAIAEKLLEAGHDNVHIAVMGYEGLSSSLPVESGPDPWIRGR
jgi:rhodanese-related sulfurtransferase